MIVGTDRTVFERARDDGSTDDFIVIQTSIELPTLFMTWRLDHELVTIMRRRDLAGRDTTEIATILRQVMAPALDGYRELPVIVEQKPWLFQ